MLNIQNLTKRYGSKTAVDNLSLHIEAGEICAFIGHNGAGQTTTLKACCGLLTPDGGAITVDGMSIRERPIDCKRVMAYIPDNPDMYEFLTGYEYLNFVADVYGVSKADRERRIAELGELLGITEALGGAISECSHGMKQKIAIISALIHKPKLILMDEPFVGLDPVAAHQLKNLMAEHCAAGGAMAGLLLLTGEQAAGLLCLVRPTKNGRGALFRRKFAAMVAELAGLFVLTYGGNLAISAAVLGLGDLRRPVQAVIGLQGCPLPLTAGEYLLCVFAGKLLWLLAAETVFFLLCACTDRAALALGSGFAVGVLGLAMQKVPVLWLQSLSLTRLASMDTFLKDCVYLNLFGLPVSRFPAALVFCAAVTAGGYAAGRAVFCRKSAVPSVKNRAARLPLPSGAHTGPLRHEGYKLLVRGGLGAALVCLLAVQIVSTRAVKPPSSEREMYYRSYSERLSGPPTAEKDAFLDAENERFAALHAQLEQAAAQAGGDTFLLEQLTADTERQLRPEDTFREAEAQYRALLPGQSYVYASGYERLFGPVGARETLAYMGLLVFALLLGLSQTMAGETESGVDVLIRTAGAQRAVLRRKLLLCALLLPAALAAAYLPRLIAVAYRYSLPLLTAPAAGLPIFRRMPPWLPLWGVLALAALARLAAAAAAGAGILALSARTKSTVYTLLIGCAVLLPVMLLILFQ